MKEILKNRRERESDVKLGRLIHKLVIRHLENDTLGVGVGLWHNRLVRGASYRSISNRYGLKACHVTAVICLRMYPLCSASSLP